MKKNNIWLKILIIFIMILMVAVTINTAFGEEENSAPVIEAVNLNGATIGNEANIPLGTEVTLEIVASDVEDDDDSLVIDEEQSTIDGTSFSDLSWISTEGLEITIGPLSAEEEHEMKIVIKDSANASSEARELTLQAKPILEIVEHSIKINGRTYDGEFAVSPGDDVKVRFDYLNNLLGGVIGYVEISAKSNQLPDFVNYKNKDWILLPGSYHGGSGDFEFTVPNEIMGDFSVMILVEDEDIEGNSYKDQVALSFKVEKELKNVMIVSAELVPEELTCGTKTDLIINLLNTGVKDLRPEVKVFTEEAQMDEEGHFNKEEIASYLAEKEDKLLPGEQVEIIIEDIDASGFSELQKLYIYAISPFFWNNENGLYIGDEETVILNKKSCLKNSLPAESEIILLSGEGQDFSVELAEEGYDDQVKWFVNNVEKGTGTTFLFSNTVYGTYYVKAAVSEIDAHSWTISVVKTIPPRIDVTELFFEEVGRDETVSKEVVIKNLGSKEPLTNFAVLLNIGSEYQASLLGDIPETLGPGEEVALQVKITIPKDEKNNKHSIGTLKITSAEDSKTTNVYVSAKSCLSLKKIEINGDSNGDLSLNEKNKFEVKVENTCDLDLENVEIAVRILDVDGNDLEEVSQEKNIGKGKEEEFTIEVDLSDEDIDEEKYIVKIEAEGEDEDGNEFSTSESKELSVEIEKHNVIVKEVELVNENLRCGEQTALYVTIENRGENDEDDVKIKVSNEELELNLERIGLELNKFGDQDNDYRASFGIYVDSGVPKGNYPLLVEVYRDGSLDDSKTINLGVTDCLSSNSLTQTQDQLTMEKELKEQLQLALLGEQNKQVVASSFRNDNSYLLLLGFLVLLCFTALVLALAVSMKKGSKEKIVKISPAKKKPIKEDKKD